MDEKETAYLIDKLREIEILTSEDQLKTYLTNVTALIGLEYFLVGISIPTTMTRAETVIIDDYPKQWRTIYDQNNFKDIDPVVTHCIHHSLPMFWENIADTANNKTINVMQEAKQYGLRSGVSIPLHTNSSQFGIVSFATSEKQIKDSISPLIATNMVLPLITDFFRRKQTRPNLSNAISLTKRELECLKWSAEGKSAWEISKILCCSERTVVFHTSNMCRKLGAANKYQAISKAIISGIMHPEY